MENTPNPKCTRCKCYWKPDETDIKTSGLVCKTCKKCRAIDLKKRNDNKCEHNKRKSTCKECGGIGICEHNKRRTICRDCGGGSICEHNRQRSHCRDCGGVSICEHNRERKQCRDCNGSSICEHNRQRSSCKECGGSSICEHNKRRTICRECGGTSICEHDRIRSRCIECGGGSICEHNKRRSSCKKCNLTLYLIHLQRIQIRKCFNISNLEKTNPSISYLGCDIKYFMEYFQKKMDLFNKFSDIEMTWDNIHIDHIKPISSFNLDDKDEFLDCCHYTNMQPLLVEINLSKSCKWTDKNEEFWLNNIKGKEYMDLYIS